MQAGRIIQPVHADDVKFCVHLAKQFTDEIGFISTAALEHYAAIGGVLQAWENGQEAGYVAGTKSKGDQPRLAQIYQAAVAMDLQRRAIGLALVNEWELRALNAGARGVQLWCAAELIANEFWQAAGYQVAKTRQGGKRRGRNHLCWFKPLVPGFELESQKETQQEAQGSVQRALFDLRHLP